MLINEWLGSNNRIEATETLDYVPLLYLNCYLIYHVVSYCLSPPIFPSLPLPSTRSFPLPLPPLLLPLDPDPLVPAIS